MCRCECKAKQGMNPVGQSSSVIADQVRGRGAGDGSSGKSRRSELLSQAVPAKMESSGAAHGPQAVRRLSRTLINLWLDVALLINFLGLGIVSVILQFVFPPGIAAGGWSLWGLNFSQWQSLQFGMLSLLTVGIVVHLMLHWTWVCSVVARNVFGETDVPDEGLQTIYGVILLIAVLLTGAVFTGLATVTIRMPSVPAADSP